jgi:hypothetical protein
MPIRLICFALAFASLGIFLPGCAFLAPQQDNVERRDGGEEDVWFGSYSAPGDPSYMMCISECYVHSECQQTCSLLPGRVACCIHQNGSYGIGKCAYESGPRCQKYTYPDRGHPEWDIYLPPLDTCPLNCSSHEQCRSRCGEEFRCLRLSDHSRPTCAPF